MQKLVLQCPYGTITRIMDDGKAVGINGRDVEDKRICRVTEAFGNVECSNEIKLDAVAKYFKESCEGKKHCTFDLLHETYNPKFFMADPTGKCLTPRTQFFVQHTCEIPEAEQEQRFNTLSFVVATMVLACGVYLFVLRFLSQNLDIDTVNFDINTITASDFTVELDITPAMWQSFIEDHYKPTGSTLTDELGGAYAPALYLKKYLIEKVEGILSSTLRLRKQHE